MLHILCRPLSDMKQLASRRHFVLHFMWSPVLKWHSTIATLEARCSDESELFIYYPLQVQVSPQTTAPPDYQTDSQPDYPGPHTFETIAVVTATIFCLINITSLMFGIPAVAFSQKVY